MSKACQQTFVNQTSRDNDARTFRHHNYNSNCGSTNLQHRALQNFPGKVSQTHARQSNLHAALPHHHALKHVKNSERVFHVLSAAEIQQGVAVLHLPQRVIPTSSHDSARHHITRHQRTATPSANLSQAVARSNKPSAVG
jgi:hypothetical protein